MAKTTLMRLVEQAGNKLESYYPDRSSLLFDLLFVILTAELPPDKKSVLRKLTNGGNRNNHKKHLKPVLDLKEFVRGYPVAQAVCARYHYRQPVTQALKEWRVHTSDWKYLHRIAREIGFGGLESFVVGSPFPFSEMPWHDHFEEDRVYVNVMFDPRAIEDMLISSQEAYFSRSRKKRKPHEVYGIVLGMRRDQHFKDKIQGDLTVRYVHIMRSQPQLSAEGRPDGVIPNRYSFEALTSIAETQFPQYEILGDFHSHPWNESNELIQQKGWKLSTQDQRSLINWMGYLRERGSADRPQVSFVVAIARGKTYKGRPHRYKNRENTLQFTIGTAENSCRIIIAAYRILESGRCSEKNISLVFPGFIQK